MCDRHHSLLFENSLSENKSKLQNVDFSSFPWEAFFFNI